jgi:hypothetical protein
MILESVDMHSFFAGLSFGWMVMLFGMVGFIMWLGRSYV